MKRHSKTSAAVVGDGLSLAGAVTTARTGQVVGFDPKTGLQVTYEGASAPVAARSTIALDTAQCEAAVGERRGVVLLFEEGDPLRPIVVGLLEQVGDPPLLELVAEATREKMEAEVDDKRVLIEGEDEIVLRCGKASITLRRNGRVLIRGFRVETRAEAVNRIKGGSVQIN